MIVLGHRGGRGEGWPAENSLEAFERALGEGADGVELDVRLCGTGEAVVLHDRSLARVTGGRDRRPAAAIARGELPRLAGGLAIPTLAEALDLCAGRIVNVEIKADAPGRMRLVREVARTLARGRGAHVVMSSFDPSVVLACGVAAPRVARAILVGQRTPRLGAFLPLAMRRAVMGAHLEDAVATPARIGRLREAGLRVVGWTIDDATRVRALREAGVDWVIADRPGALLAALRG